MEAQKWWPSFVTMLLNWNFLLSSVATDGKTFSAPEAFWSVPRIGTSDWNQACMKLLYSFCDLSWSDLAENTTIVTVPLCVLSQSDLILIGFCVLSQSDLSDNHRHLVFSTVSETCIQPDVLILGADQNNHGLRERAMERMEMDWKANFFKLWTVLEKLSKISSSC